MAIIIKHVRLAPVLFLCAGLVSSAHADTRIYALKTKEGSRIELHGDSTLHKWRAYSDNAVITTTAVVNMVAGVSDKTLMDTIVLAAIKREFVVSVPVKTIKSGTGGLASRLRKALKYKEFPEITFRMTGYAVNKSTGTDVEAGVELGTGSIVGTSATPEAVPAAWGENDYVVDIKGLLTILEETKEIRFQLFVRTGDSGISVEGEYKLCMTDYGVKPPRLLFIKTRDEILIKWALFFGTENRDRQSGEVAQFVE